MFSWLFLDEKGLSPAELARWRISALRIILVSGFVLEAAIAVHSSINAIAIGAYHVVWIVAVFYVLLTLGLYFSARRLEVGATLLILTVYAAAASIVFFIEVDEVAKLGILFVYTTPLIARLFFGGQLAICLMLLNFIPFFVLLRNAPLVHFDVVNTTLEASHGYIHSLLFLFFNVCVPLAVFRVLHALDASAARYREASASLADSHARYREFFENSGAPVMLCSDTGEVMQANRRALELTGLSSAELLGHSFFTRVFRRQEGATLRSLSDLVGQQFTSLTGQSVVVQEVSQTTHGGVIVVLHDVSPLFEARQALRLSRERESFLSNYDVLTRLPNKEMLLRHLAAALAVLSADRIVSLVSFRLNSIRHANEKFGTAVGDRFIQQFADGLRIALPEKGFCARLRGAVFSIVLPPMQGAAEVFDQVEALRNAFPREISVDGNPIFVQVSTGVALARNSDISAGELIRRSEAALERARRSSDDTAALFDESDAAAVRRHIELELGLVAALKNEELRMVYQPKIGNDGSMVGLEALLRWRSGHFGAVSPGEFIPVAESCGLVHDLTCVVLEKTCAFIRRLLDRGVRCPPVALNLSALDIVRDDLLARIGGVVERYKVPYSLLEFEITETGLIGNERLAVRHLKEIEKRGSRLFIDDFGTGYSSLSKLSSFPVNGIKIDRSFVSKIGSCAKSELIVKSIVSLARMMSCVTIAEGVETDDQLSFLREHGCDIFQGYYFYPPLEESQLDALLLPEAVLPA